MSWCFANDIKLVVKPLSISRKSKVVIEIHREGKIQKGKEIYRQEKELTDKIQELYIYLYNTLK